MNDSLFNIGFALYLLALIAFGWAHLSKTSRAVVAGDGLLVLGWAFHSAYIAVRWVQAGRAPMSNMYESLVILSWGVVVLAFAFRRMAKKPLLRLGFAGLALVVMAGASSFDRSIRPLMPALQSNWLLYHVIVTMLGYAAFGLAAVAGVIVLIEDELPEGSSVEAFAYRALSLGFLLLTGGIILGAVWANQAWGTYWGWDPKETWSLITWLAYAVILHLRRTKAWRGRSFAWLSIAGVAFVLFTYFGVNYLLSGLHSYAE